MTPEVNWLYTYILVKNYLEEVNEYGDSQPTLLLDDRTSRRFVSSFYLSKIPLSIIIIFPS